MCGVAEKARIGSDLFRSRCSAGGKASNTIAQFAPDFPRKESVCRDATGNRAQLARWDTIGTLVGLASDIIELFPLF
jgi:hypothetical protein